MDWMIFPNRLYDSLWFQTVRQQRVVGVIIHKPLHDGICLWMEDKLSSFQSYRCVSCYTLAFHHILDVFKRKMFHWFLPNGTM